MNYSVGGAKSLINGFPEVKLARREDFLKVMETLTRIGVSDEDADSLVQSCHILHKMGRYYIAHWKEMKMLDGEHVEFTDFDRGVRNQVAFLLHEWKLVELVDPSHVEDKTPMSYITVVRHCDKNEWKLVPMHEMGKKRNPTYVSSR